MMPRALWTIARYTLLEALHNRLIWLLALVALTAVGASGFLNELALTESRQVQLAVLAALLRLSGVFLIASFVVTSMVREANDKGQELLLALALSRATYLLGKLLGFFLLALLPALLFGALTMFFAPAAQSALWTVSLLCELWIVAAFSLLCVVSIRQVMPAMFASAGFYLLARVIGTFQLLGQAPAGARTTGQQVITGALDLLAAVLPQLDAFTRTEWLVYHTGSAAVLPAVLTQTLIYVGLIGTAALFDFYRKSI